MRILILNTSDNTGGAAIAARRLLHALVACGHEARMLVRDKTTDDPLVEAVGGRWTKAVDRARIFAANGFTKDKLWLTDAAFCGCRVTTHPLFRWADVVHLHWVSQGFLSLGEIDRVIHSGKKVVWTMHDLWPASSICHYAADCVKFHDGCHDCEQLCRPSATDLSYKVFARKQRMLACTDITFVACSRWLADQARRSALVKGCRVVDIPNTIDTDVFVPSAEAFVGQVESAPKAHITENRKQSILFSSANVNDERKGMRYLVEALSLLQDLKEDVEVVVLGKNSEDIRLPLPVRSVPYLSDPRQIAALNASVDVFVTPSLQDNLPNTIMEAMACGTACVGFEVGGIPEMIDHRLNGYVARVRDSRDLAEGIRQALTHRVEWGEAARQKVLATYSAEAVVSRYAEVYS